MFDIYIRKSELLRNEIIEDIKSKLFSKKKILEERQRLLQSPNPTVRSEDEVIKLTTQFLKESVNEKLDDPNLRYFEETFDIVYLKHNNNWEMQESPQFSKAMFFNLQFNSLTQN